MGERAPHARVPGVRNRIGGILTWLLRSSAGRAWSARRLGRLVAAADPVRLHLGCGPRLLPGWINIDFILGADVLLDLRQPLPLPDASVDFIYSEDFLEHIGFQPGRRLLAECARVLKPGGTMRLATPDLTGLARAYLERSERSLAWYRKQFGGITTYAQMFNAGMRAWGHQFLYDEEALRSVLEPLGLEVERTAYNESEAPDLRGLEYRDTAEGAQSMYIEAHRPPRRAFAPAVAPLVTIDEIGGKRDRI